MSEIGEKIIAKIREHVAARPDFVYLNHDSCVYVEDGAPSCLVGRALWDLNLIGPELERDDAKVTQRDSGCTAMPNILVAHDLLEHLGIKVDPADETWIDAVQDWQDSEKPWGAAERHADTLMMADA